MYWLLRLLMALFGRLPLSWTQRTARTVGRLMWYILPSRRKAAIINAEIIGVQNPKRVAKESFKHTFMSFMEIVYAAKVDKKFCERYVTFENEDKLRELEKKGQVYSFISAHLGSWDLASSVNAVRNNTKMVIVGREATSKSFNRILEYIRNTSDLIYVNQYGFLEKIREYEDRGYVAGSLTDHVGTGNDSLFVPFFSYQVETLMGMAVMAVRKKIPLLPAYLIRRDGGFTFVFRDPLYPNVKLKPKKRIYDLLLRMNREFESIIREHPEQWFLMHRRFKRVEEEDGTISRNLY